MSIGAKFRSQLKVYSAESVWRVSKEPRNW